MLLAATASKPAPLIVTRLPAGAERGLTDEMAGCAKAHCGAASMNAKRKLRRRQRGLDLLDGSKKPAVFRQAGSERLRRMACRTRKKFLCMVLLLSFPLFIA